MEIQNDFELPVNVDTAWQALSDLSRVASCMPGANLTEVDPDGTHRGTVGVKLGPVSMNFMGEARIAKAVRETGLLVVEGVGSERRGRGRATTRIEIQLADELDKTKIQINAVIELSGSVAQYGSRGGILEDVSQEFIGQFVRSLREEILHGEPAGARISAAEPMVPCGAKVVSDVQGDRESTEADEIRYSPPTGLSFLIPAPDPTPGSTASLTARIRPAASRPLTDAPMPGRSRRAGSGASPGISVLAIAIKVFRRRLIRLAGRFRRGEKRSAAARRDLI